ncbi:FMN-binding protein [Dactylosporangium sp. CA-092794]|uniref:FMN-binding protein n=1 Tax=Dactylosporangium sp. CA-092794 TaxID=3239929 RepID=UPI003D89C685
MRRALMALLGTAAGTVLLVGAKSGFGGPGDQALQPQSANGPIPGGSAAQPPGPQASPPPGAAPGAAAAGAGQPSAAKTQPADANTAPATTAPKGTTMRDGTFNGNPIYIDYGVVELSIVVSRGKITDIKVLDSPSDESRSVQINKSALPKLKAEALAAQSADIDTVSGATETSAGYKLSLRSAIDRAYQG